MMTISIKGRKDFETLPPTSSIRRFLTSVVRAGEAKITRRKQTTWKWSWTIIEISTFMTKSFCRLIKKGPTSTFTNRIKLQEKNLIEIWKYESNIAYAKQIRTLTQLVYITSTKEKQIYKNKKIASILGGRSSSFGGSAARTSMLSMRMSIGGGMKDNHERQ